jgi:hypothetical protein
MPITNLLQRIRLRTIVLLAVSTIVAAGLAYLAISICFPMHGVLEGGDPVGQRNSLIVMLLKCLYLSVTTFTSIGYADLVPGDGVKFIVVIEVVCGVSIIGLAVAKLVSLASHDLQRAQARCVNGYWINRIPTGSGQFTHGLVTFKSDGTFGLVYFGENYSRSGECLGGFSCHLVHLVWPRTVFRWQDKDNDLFTEGEVRIRFYETEGTLFPAAYRFEGRIVEFGVRDSKHVEGWRITDTETLKRLESPLTRISTIKDLIARYFPPDTGA